jgi:CxxC-x17-CxxC domain-containing protein
MEFTDQTIKCVSCEDEFTFSADEQKFYKEKNFESAPKRCKKCRKAAKQRKRNNKSPYGGDYRSPAFSDPNFRGKGRGQQNNHRRRKPAPQPSKFDQEYRSPAFREYEAMDNAEEYRSPGFSEYKNINAEEEYRSPAFQEYSNINPQDEYRSPAFHGERQKYKSERPMFEITCEACGQQAMVPFLPEEKDEPMCKDCYREHKQMLKAELAAEAESLKDAADTPATEESAEEATATETTTADES